MKAKFSAGKSGHNSKKHDRIVLIAAVAVFVILCGIGAGVLLSSNGEIFPVHINEVMASNTRYPNTDGRCCDFIELYNTADYPVDLSNFELGDIGGNQRYTFPTGTVLGAGEYLVVYCDKDAGNDAYAPFGISRAGGETIYLLTAHNVIADSVVTMAMEPDQSMVYLGNEKWELSDFATPGAGNDGASWTGREMYNPQVSPVRVTEMMAASPYCDWIELYNTSGQSVDISGYILSDNVNVDKYRFPEGTVLEPGAYLTVYCSSELGGSLCAPFGLSQTRGEYVVFKNEQGMIVQIVDCVLMAENESLAMGADGSWALTQKNTPGYENTDAGYDAYLQETGIGGRKIVISEVMSASQSVLADSFGEFSDWVELRNVSEEAVDLTGWFLSDDPMKPAKWAMPVTVLQPGEYLVVFCSGRDVQVNGELHSSFSLAAGGESLILSSFAGVPVDSVTFGAAKDNVSFVFDGITAEPLTTLYPTPGYANDPDGYESFCAGNVAAGPLAIWEVMTSNDWYLPQALGACYDWVEIRNTSKEPVQLANYSISDDLDDPRMYILPNRTLDPGEVCVILLSGDTSLSNQDYAHAGFSLNAMSDQLFLFEISGKLLDHVTLNQVPLGYSYGRSQESGGFFYMEPTPEKENHSGYRLISGMPTSSIEPGVYASQTSVEVPLDAVGTVYYTTDGSDPDIFSKRYEGPVTINQTTVLRAVAVEDGKLQSDIYTATFVIQEPHDIPIVSLVTDPDNLWGSTGIYKYNLEVKEEKRSANLAYEGEDGSFSIDCEISLHGGITVTAMDKKSFTIRFHDNYEGPLNYDLFEDGEVTKFSSLLLRASHESTYSSHIRDALMGHVASCSSDAMVAQKFKYVAMYLNGEYWGLYALREHHSEEHFATYQDVPLSSVARPQKFAQGMNSLTDIYKFSLNNHFGSEKNFAYAKSVLDLDSFVDWIIFESYTGNIDINENMRYYYTSADGKWHCGLVDVDLGMFSYQGFETVTEAFHHGEIPAALMVNEEFRDMVARRLAELLEGPLSDEAMIANIDWMAGIIRNEVALDCARWGGTQKHWERMVVDLKTFCDGRSQRMINSLSSMIHLTEEEKMEYFGHLLQ